GVRPRESGERKLAVVIELNEFVVLLGGTLRFVRIRDVLDDELAIGFEEGNDLVGKRIYGFIRHEALGVLSPAERGRQREQQYKRGDDAERCDLSEGRSVGGASLRTTHQGFSPIPEPAAEFAVASWLWLRP